MTIQTELDAAKEIHKELRAAKEKANELSSNNTLLKYQLPYSSEVIVANNAWYKAFAQKTLYALMFVVFCATLLSIALTYAVTRPPEVLSYLQDEDGNVVKLSPIKNVKHTDASVISWAADRLHKINHLSFAEYNTQLQNLVPDFTQSAYRNFRRSLEYSKHFDKLHNNRLTSYIKLDKAPIIVDFNESGDSPVWVLEFKYTLFMGGGNAQTQGASLTAHMVVEQTAENPDLSGLIISKYLVKEGNS